MEFVVTNCCVLCLRTEECVEGDETSLMLGG